MARQVAARASGGPSGTCQSRTPLRVKLITALLALVGRRPRSSSAWLASPSLRNDLLGPYDSQLQGPLLVASTANTAVASYLQHWADLHGPVASPSTGSRLTVRCISVVLPFSQSTPARELPEPDRRRRDPRDVRTGRSSQPRLDQLPPESALHGGVPERDRAVAGAGIETVPLSNGIDWHDRPRRRCLQRLHDHRPARHHRLLRQRHSAARPAGDRLRCRAARACGR